MPEDDWDTDPDIVEDSDKSTPADKRQIFSKGLFSQAKTPLSSSASGAISPISVEKLRELQEKLTPRTVSNANDAARAAVIEPATQPVNPTSSQPISSKAPLPPPPPVKGKSFSKKLPSTETEVSKEEHKEARVATPRPLSKAPESLREFGSLISQALSKRRQGVADDSPPRRQILASPPLLLIMPATLEHIPVINQMPDNPFGISIQQMMQDKNKALIMQLTIQLADENTHIRFKTIDVKGQPAILLQINPKLSPDKMPDLIAKTMAFVTYFAPNNATLLAMPSPHQEMVIKALQMCIPTVKPKKLQLAKVDNPKPASGSRPSTK